MTFIYASFRDTLACTEYFGKRVAGMQAIKIDSVVCGSTTSVHYEQPLQMVQEDTDSLLEKACEFLRREMSAVSFYYLAISQAVIGDTFLPE